MKKAIRFPWKLFARIVGLQALSVLLALGASGVAARHFFKAQFLSQVEHQLYLSLGSLSRDLPPQAGQDWCVKHSFDPSQRLTVIDQKGDVLCDSRHDPETMENHLARPEIQMALREGFGHSSRYSATMSESTIYGALWLKKRGLFLRGATPIETLVSTLSVFDASLALFMVAVALVLVGFAVWSGRKLSFPIGRMLYKIRNAGTDLMEEPEPFSDEPVGELSELESSLDRIREDLHDQAESLHREREEHALLMRAISDAILAVDLEGLPLFFNSRFAILFGQGNALQEGKTQLWEIFRSPEILESFRAALKHGREGQVSALAWEHEGAERYFSLSVSPLRRPLTGEVYGAVGIFHDVSELKRAEQMRIEFVANVSHELRTPLTAIKGYADTMAGDFDAGKPIEKDFVLAIQRNSGRLMNLIQDLLDLSSLESGMEELQAQAIDTAELSEKVLRNIEGAAKQKGQNLSLDVKTGSVIADPARLEQVLVNLLDNAVKYTPAGGTVSVSWLPLPGGGVELRVCDTGPGISSEHHGHLFERFYRVDKARSRQLGGTGLGLAIVKHIMQRHGGSVRVESQLGKGSAFICTFPGANQPSS
jgi:two-component system phosphate regulon sensor histidine kinase PhoR